MDPLGGLALGFAEASTHPTVLVAAVIGVLLGTVVGVLPGMTPTATIAVLLTFTAHFSTETAFILLGGIYFGSQYGNSITAILLNIPSEAPSVVVARHGYRMTRRGRSGAALSGAAIGSFIGVAIGLVGLSLLAPTLSHVAVGFGPPEFFTITLVGLGALVVFMNRSGAKGVLSVCIGLALGTVGVDPISGLSRYTFGISGLLSGINLVPVAVGLFGMAELLRRYGRTADDVLRVPGFRELLPTREEWKRTGVSGTRGGIIGFILGSIPGPSLLMGVFGSYAVEEKLAKRKYGTALEDGHIELVAGPKGADDAAVSGALVPLLTLGLPFTPVTAMLFASLLLHNVHPGPLFIQDDPRVFWGLVVAMGIGNIVLLILNFPLVGLWVRILRVPEKYRFALLMLVMILGVYSLRYSFFDLWVLLASGICGLALVRWGFDRLLLLLALILGPPMETALRESLLLSRGNPLIFVTQPVSAGILGVFVVLMVIVGVMRLRKYGFSAAVGSRDSTV